MTKFVLAFALSVAAVASPAAAEGPAHRSVSVPVADLNLATEQGRATLDKRLNAAIDRVCGVHKSPGLPAWIRVRKCIEAKRREVQPVRDAIVARAQASAKVAAR